VNITVQPKMASDKSLQIIVTLAAVLLIIFFAFKMRKPANPYAHVPRAIATKVPNKLISIRPPVKEDAFFASGEVEAAKERHLPAKVMQSGFQSIQPTSWEIEEQQRRQQQQQRQKKAKQNGSVDQSLYDKEYQKKYAQWQRKHGDMKVVPDSIINAYPDGFTFHIKDPYSRRFNPASVALLSRCHPVDGFDMPVGAPNGNGYSFGRRLERPWWRQQRFGRPGLCYRRWCCLLVENEQGQLGEYCPPYS